MKVAEVAEVSVERYHGCGRFNRNSTRKLINYKRRERFLFRTNDCCWRKTKPKYLVERPYLNSSKGKIIKTFLKLSLIGIR